MHLLASASRPRFYLLVEVSSLIVGLAIGGAVLIGGEFAVGFSGCFLCKVVTSLQRYWMANTGSQVFFSLG